MAESKRRPRIRKTAPTVRELAQAKQNEPEVKARRISWLGRLLKFPKRLLRPIWRPFARVLGFITPKYFKNSWREIQQVTWPTRRETWRLTLAVFVFATVFGVIIYGVDIGLDKLFKKLVLK